MLIKIFFLSCPIVKKTVDFLSRTKESAPELICSSCLVILRLGIIERLHAICFVFSS